MANVQQLISYAHIPNVVVSLGIGDSKGEWETMEHKEAVAYFKEAIKESDEIIEECSNDLKAELINQKKHFIIAVKALEKQTPKKVVPNKRIKSLGKCPICNTELCIDAEDLHYCPTCGQALKC